MSHFPTAQDLQDQSARVTEAHAASRRANAYKDPLQAFRKACESGAVSATVEAFTAKLPISVICDRVRDLLEECDGDSSLVLQECLEALEADRKVIETL